VHDLLEGGGVGTAGGAFTEGARGEGATDPVEDEAVGIAVETLIDEFKASTSVGTLRACADTTGAVRSIENGDATEGAEPLVEDCSRF
jgi:hypothetical protein